MKLSVVIPTLNEREFLGELLRQIEPRDDVEVVVVDANSADGTAEVAEEHSVKVLRCGGDVSAARNMGAKEAKGGYLLFLDADQDLWSEQPMTDLLMWLRSNPVFVGTGPIQQTSNTRNIWSDARELFRSAHMVLSGGYTLIRKDVFDRLGGFRPRAACLFWWEDVDLSWRCEAAGYEIARLPFATVHKRPFTMRLPNGMRLW